MSAGFIKKCRDIPRCVRRFIKKCRDKPRCIRFFNHTPYNKKGFRFRNPFKRSIKLLLLLNCKRKNRLFKFEHLACANGVSFSHVIQTSKGCCRHTISFSNSRYRVTALDSVGRRDLCCLAIRIYSFVSLL